MQCGQGVGDIGTLYRNPVYFQRGSGFGLGSFFLGLSKHLIPVLKKTGEILTNQAVESGKGIIGDITATAFGRSNKSLRQILADQGSDAISNLSNQAIRGLKRKLGTQLGSGRGPKRIKTLRRTKKRRIVRPTAKRKRRVVRKKSKPKSKKRKVTKKKTTKRKSLIRRKKRILDIFE